MSDEIKAPGLAPPEAVIDAAAMRDLLASLDALAGGKRATEMTRAEIIAVLNGVAQAMRPAMLISIGTNVTSDHPLVEFLVELAGMIGDLGNGKTHPQLKPYSHGATASLTAKDANQHEVLVEAVALIAQQRSGDKTWKKAATRVIEDMKCAGKEFGGKPLTVNRLKSWHYAYRRKYQPKPSE